MVVMRDVDHVICVDCAEGCEAVTHDGEQSD